MDEHGPLIADLATKIVIFYSYLSGPEATWPWYDAGDVHGFISWIDPEKLPGRSAHLLHLKASWNIEDFRGFNDEFNIRGILYDSMIGIPSI